MSIAAIIAAITAIFTAIPIIIKLFSVAPETTKEHIDKAVDDEEKKLNQTGRPS